jgi:hypothetical protein
MADDQATKERFETAKVIYQASMSEIISFKDSQWKVTNYGLLAYAGIAGAAKLLYVKLPSFVPYLAFVSLSLVCLCGIWIERHLEFSLARGRVRMSRSRAAMKADEFTENTGIKGGEESLFPLFCAAFIIGFFLSLSTLFVLQ